MEITWKPTTAGILSIVAGAGGLIAGIVVVALGRILASLPGWLGVEKIDTTFITLGEIAGTALIVSGIIATVGGIFALRRRIWGMALAGSICALLSEPILGILAIIFVAMSKREFA